MKYQQIQLARLAEAGRKLVKDGNWHPFEEVPATYYRVIGRTMQRVKLEDGEDTTLLHLFDDVPKLPWKTLREGFRNELSFRIDDDSFVLDDIFTRSFTSWEILAEAGAKHHIAAEAVGGNALRWNIRIDEWNEPEILHALLLAKAITRAVSRRITGEKENLHAMLETEIRALRQTLNSDNDEAQDGLS